MSERRVLRKRENVEMIKNVNKKCTRPNKNVIRKIIDTDESENQTSDQSDVDFRSDDSIIDHDWLPNSTNSEYDSNERSIGEVLRDLALQEDEDELNESGNDQVDDDELVRVVDGWSEYIGRHTKFPFTGLHSVQQIISSDCTPLDIFRLIVDEAVVNHIVTETNIFAEQTMNAKVVSNHARITKWIPTDAAEMDNRFSLMMWMGLVRLSALPDYWSSQGIYKQQLPRISMARNRFQILLTMLHFNDNEIDNETSNRLRKLQLLVDMLENKFKNLFYPGEEIVIDETLVPWRGKLIFRQYIPNKAHRYGIKLFKLCSVDGYTCALKIYSGRSSSGEREISLAINICLKLMGSLLNEGRTLHVDNFYTSYGSAKNLLEQKTHLIGTLRSNKKDIPQEVLLAKLKRGEIISREDANRIVVLTWKDIRDVRLLSTKHAPHLVPANNPRIQTQPCSSNAHLEAAENLRLSQRRKPRRAVVKPLPILAYNKGKAGIDISDQMASYCTTLRKGVKWYRKLGIELILGVAVVNAWVVYKHITKKKIPIRTFREEIVESLLKLDDKPPSHVPCVSKHLLITRTNENGEKVRRKCVQCYANIQAEEGREAARRWAKMVYTYCKQCPRAPQLCLNCFNSKHKSRNYRL